MKKQIEKVLWINLLIAFLFAICIFVKELLFHWYIFQSLLFSSIWTDPSYFWSFYLPKICAALLIASFVPFFKNKIWTIVFSIAIDIWLLANIIYFRSNQLFLDVYALSTAGNMKGFWSSVWLFIDWKAISFFIITILWCLILYLFCRFQTKTRNVKMGIVGLLIAYMCSFAGLEMFRIRYERDLNLSAGNLEHYFSSLDPNMRSRLLTKDTNRCVRQFSILHLVGFNIVDAIEMSSNQVEMSNEDIVFLQRFIKDDGVSKANIASGPLIIVVFESMENWIINDISMPNLSRFIATHPNHLWATSVRSQVKGGNSMDGQTLINTGILPISHGAACLLFPNNIYPSLSRCYDLRSKKTTIVPHDIHVWNQSYMSTAFGYDTTMQVEPNEEYLCEKGVDCINNGYSVVQLVTIASHAPFSLGVENSTLQIAKDMPKYMEEYMKACYYTDNNLQILFDAYDNNPNFKNATLVITGDHTIFYPELRREFKHFCQENNLSFDVESAYCPLLVFSPSITSPTKIEQECYQMDVYPTILSAIGGEDYFWKGFGVSMLGEPTNALMGGGKMLHSRVITEDKAYDVSDKIIRSNYFGNKFKSR